MLDYIRDGQEIYRQSFATIRAEANLSHLPADLEKLAVRVIHACVMVDIVDALRFSAGAGRAGRAALAAGAPILCDARMVAEGITRARLPAGNDVICTLGEPAVPALARELIDPLHEPRIERQRDVVEIVFRLDLGRDLLPVQDRVGRHRVRAAWPAGGTGRPPPTRSGRSRRRRSRRRTSG